MVLFADLVLHRNAIVLAQRVDPDLEVVLAAALLLHITK